MAKPDCHWKAHGKAIQSHGNSSLTPRQQRFLHAAKLLEEIDTVTQLEAQALAAAGIVPTDSPGICIDIEGFLGQSLKTESLETSVSPRIELLNVKIENDTIKATVFIPAERTDVLKGKIIDYSNEAKDSKKGTPRNRELVDSIATIRLNQLSSSWFDAKALPINPDQEFSWEVWLRKDAIDQVRQAAERLDLFIARATLTFPEREICLIRGSLSKLALLHIITKAVAGFKYQDEMPRFFTDMPNFEQAAWADNLLARTQFTPAGRGTTAVCLLDTGITVGNPLIRPAISDGEAEAYEKAWGAADEHGHGTQMAGLALYGDLAPLVVGGQQVEIPHRLESIKFVSPRQPHPEELWGVVTQECTARATMLNVAAKRVFCMAVTAPGDTHGKPTAWSATVDKIAAGVSYDNSITDDDKQLMIISAGNVAEDDLLAYPSSNEQSQIENPAQAWNAVTVGAATHKTLTDDKSLEGWNLVASPGDIAPSSRTSIGWGRQSEWPIKPEIVMEGGNWVTDGTNVDRNDDLCLLTAGRGSVFSTLADTSAACAQASRLAAILHAKYSDLWPESVRGLLVHSAAWTEAMLAGSAIADLSSVDKIRLMRKFGYGQPNLACAEFSASNRACVIIQDVLQPFSLNESNVVLNEMHLHKLPWPSELIREVPGSVKVRITLSYYIEPNPSDRLPDGKYAYASHGLRFELKGPAESMDVFRQRVNGLERDEGYQTYYRPNWLLGPQARNRGSIISDIWEGTGAELAEQDALVIFPMGGWWKYRKFHERYNEKVRYSLIVTLESEDAEIDIYSEIENIIATRVATTVATPV
jgi:hypothetical protein